MREQWSPVRKALKQRYSDQQSVLLDRVRQVINHLVRHKVDPQPTLYALPAAVKSLTQEQFQIGLDLASFSAEREIDPAATLQRGLVTAANALDIAQFNAAIDFSLRLIGKGIDPCNALQFALPAAAKNSTAPQEFQAHLDTLGRFIIDQGGHQYPRALGNLQALAAALTPELFRAALETAGSLAENGLDPSVMLHSLPAAAAAFLAEEQLLAGMDLCRHLAAKKVDLGEALRTGFTAAAQVLERPELLDGLDAVSRLAEKQIHPAVMLQYGIPTAAAARTTPEDFRLNLQALEQFAVSVGAQGHNEYSGTLQALSAVSLTAEQLRASLNLATRLAERKIDPGQTLRAGLPPALQSSSQPGEFETNLAAFEQFVARITSQERNRQDDARRNSPYWEQRNWSTSLLHNLLQAIPPSGLNSRQYCASLDLVARLAENNHANPVTLLPHGLLAAAKACTTPEDFQANLSSLEQFLARLAERRIRNDHTLASSFQTALNVQSRADFELRLQTLGALIARLEEQNLSAHTAPGLADLTKQAIALKQSYEDFELILHPAITSEYQDYDPYYGSTTSTREDHHAWMELRPVGRRLTPIPLALMGREQIERLLEQRSWLWNDSADRAAHEQVIERIIHLRTYLLTILDRLVRHGALDPATKLSSVYLIGSYPWVPAPNDVDLFLVVSGARDAVYLPTTALVRRGVQIPELPIGVSVEIVGHETLLRASQGQNVAHANVLPKRYALLYGYVLLGGNDLFQSAEAPAKLLKELHQDLLNNMERADWPELAGDSNKIAAKKAWRKREAAALEKFLNEKLTR